MNTYGYVGGSPLFYIDSNGLYRQWGVGVSASVNMLLIGLNLGVSGGISLPDDLTRIRCYQVFLSINGAPMIAGGLFAGIGGNVSASTSDNPLSVTNSGIYRYSEINAGWGPAASISNQGKEDVTGKPLSDAFDVQKWGEFLEKPQDSRAFALPAFPGAGFSVVNSVATPVADDCNESPQQCF